MTDVRRGRIEKIAFLGGLVGACLFNTVIFLFMLWRFPRFMESLFTGHLFMKSDLTNVDPTTAAAIHDLAEKGVVTTPDEILTATADFYEVLVIVLVSLLGLFGVIAFMYVRAISRANAEDVAHSAGTRAVKTHLRSSKFKADFEKALDERTQDLNERLERLDGLDARLQKIEKAIGEGDQEENIPEEQLPEQNGPNGEA